MKNKHLTLSERITIQEMLERKQSFRTIAQELDKSISTISREIRRNRYKKSKANLYVDCSKIPKCTVTHACGDDTCRRFCMYCVSFCNTTNCPEYDPKICYYHTHAPFVCNGCDPAKRRNCYQERYYYDARLAQSTYEKTLISSREGVSLSPDKMEKIDSLVSPLLLNGHSLQAIYMNHKDEIPCSMRKQPETLTCHGKCVTSSVTNMIVVINPCNRFALGAHMQILKNLFKTPLI